MRERRIKRIAWATLVLVYLVIVAGGVVRTTGSGMGCPDWPKCFGQWVPPTQESELPSDYREAHAERNKEKVEKLTGYLNLIGMDETAKRVEEETSRDQEEVFNVSKTWTEYVNRLVGFLAGNFLLLQTILMFIWLRKTRTRLVVLSVLNLVFIGFQAWLGSIVVATNLLPGVITIHFIFALLIILIQLIIISRLMGKPLSFMKKPMGLKILIGAAVIATTYQIFSGTQVRQLVDVLEPDSVFEKGIFLFHRSFAWIVLLLNLGMVYMLFKHKEARKILYLILAVLLSETIIGVVLYKFDIPQWAQPFHVTLGCILFGLQVWLILRVFNYNKPLENTALSGT